MKKKGKKKKKKKGSKYFSEIISLKRYFKNSGTHREKNQYPCDSHKKYFTYFLE